VPCRSSLSQYPTRAPPPIAPCRTFLSEYPQRAAEVPCQYSPRAPPVEPCRTSLSEYHEELQKFPVNTHQELPPLSPAEFPCQSITKSCRSSLSVLKKSSTPIAPCRTSLSEYPQRAEVPCQYSPRAPPVEPCRTSLSEYHQELQKFPVRVLTKSSTPLLRPAKVPCHGTHQTLHSVLHLQP